MIQTCIRRLHKLEDSLLALLLLTMILLAVSDIVMRNLLGSGAAWIPPILRIMVLWLGLLGALMATRSQEHIAIDVLSRSLSETGKRYASAGGALFAALVCGCIAWFSVEFVVSAMEYNDMAFARVPAWPLQLVIPFSFALMTLRFLIHTAGYLMHDDYAELISEEPNIEETPGTEETPDTPEANNPAIKETTHTGEQRS
jgi:TRAP-type C4-dicarboxylate transport system permease small subunit